ncbi:dihydrofolate reductase family protein [Streptomycetaceae bacterium NBC_01309]
MRRIIASTFTTLDGYIDDPHEWSLRYNDAGAQKRALDLTMRADALLLGRITYEGMAQAWPSMGGNPYADHVNALVKYVVASEPVDITMWGQTSVIAGGDLVEEAGRLRRQDGADILIWGSGRLTDGLAAASLLDEYHIWVYPVLKGRGRPLFRPESTGPVELIDTATFDSGVVLLTYRATAP